ncbi:Cytochrome c mitochondrial import factor CYC2 [Golovinomyces cichoracearum]|uniref:Cytochrome c mitochondrial import factor CYC2 n=1 Tax=Golovinomyces cichoracearum TaxID=62708 RepID=A0A420I6F4_9PEZI|nr:Cytochrome c mitochondrial import factor CYC2 [Golovinomyces cichoracearum]
MKRFYRDSQRIKSILTTRLIKFRPGNFNPSYNQAPCKSFTSFIFCQDKNELQRQDNLRLIKDGIHETCLRSIRTYDRISDEKRYFNLKRGYQTVSHDSHLNLKKDENSRSSRYKKKIFLGGGIISLFSLVWFFVEEYVQDNKLRPILNPTKFTPFEIVKRDTISSTSFLLTLQTYLKNHPSLDPDPYKEWWEKGIWSVEAKQPEMQIARSYTPLPPLSGESLENIQLLVRKEYRGEMTSYLNRLYTGSPLQLRGPRQEFEIPKEVSQVLFFAGGTGIAPALQVVHHLLERRIVNGNSPSIHIVWANRRKEDCQGGGRDVVIGKNSLASPGENYNPIVKYLQEMQRLHPDQLKVQYYIDEENIILTPNTVVQLVTSLNKKLPYPEGSRLILVSGPEGFIEFIAGPRELENGKLGQGKLGGVLGNINLKEWNIWKL